MGIENRRAKRIAVSATIQLKELEVIHEGQQIEKKKPVDVDVIDISETGMGFASPVHFEKDTFFDANIHFDGMGTVHAVIRIVRFDEEESKENHYVYGCEFVGMNTEDKFRLNVYRLVQESKIENQNESQANQQ